jgi:hypothetical protein
VRSYDLIREIPRRFTAYQARKVNVESWSHRTYVRWDPTTKHLPSAAVDLYVQLSRSRSAKSVQAVAGSSGGVRRQHATEGSTVKTIKNPAGPVVAELRDKV